MSLNFNKLQFLVFFFFICPQLSYSKNKTSSFFKNLFFSEKSKSVGLEVLFEEKRQDPPFKVEVVTRGLDIIWGMVFLNEKELLWTERQGSLKKINLETGKITPILLNIENLYDSGQGGLLDLSLHPNFKENGWIYFTYSISKGNKQSTALGRGVLKENEIESFETLFIAQAFYNSRRHFGSRLAFDSQNFLFLTVGDRANKKQAQNLFSHAGKLLRLDENGKALPDNPFFKNKKALPEIYSYGHRNPQGLFIHQEKIYLQEHGPRGGDEINIIKKGANYGWPVITHGRAYSGLKIGEGHSKKGMEQPLKHWTPSIAPSGLLIYSGKKFPQWKGDFFSGSLILTHLNKLQFRNNKFINEKRLLSNLGFRFRHIIEGPEGYLWVGVDQGMILKISPL